MQTSQPKGVKQNTRKHKLRRGVNWQGQLKQKGVRQMGVKQGLVVCG
jgi:hypothetical protein